MLRELDPEERDALYHGLVAVGPCAARRAARSLIIR